jgi:actin-related protein 5
VEKGIIKDFGMFEHTCDYIFRYLGFKDNALDCDLVISEAINTPLNSRKSMMELLFECYGVVRVLPVVGALVDNYTQLQKEVSKVNSQDFRLDKHPIEFGMIIQLGYTCCTVIPIVNHTVQHKYARTINVGTKNVYNYLCTQMIYKYEHLGVFMDHATLSMIYNKYLHAAYDYEA